MNALPTDDRALVEALLKRDERVFKTLTTTLYRSMLRVAQLYCPSEAVAQEVVQETWLAVLQGLPRFAFRSSLKTWIFRILANRARTRGTRERRSVSLDALLGDDNSSGIDPSRFDRRGNWMNPPAEFDPMRAADDKRFLEALAEELDRLPAAQRTVVMLRDVEGLSTQEVAESLEITPVHARVLLHRGRARLRDALEPHFQGQ
ncbi:MAG: RNA polymerase sigma-70 factor (ECF subfamily) [Myxococcota bacterium]|jgi:RNA polymerase sigma-70 factor (ECF subfamily)